MQQTERAKEGSVLRTEVKRIVVRNPWTILASAGWTILSAGSLIWERDVATLANAALACAFLIGSLFGSRFTFLAGFMRVRIWGIAWCEFQYGMDIHLDGPTLRIATTRLKWPLATPRMEEALRLIKRTYESTDAREQESPVALHRFLWLFG